MWVGKRGEELNDEEQNDEVLVITYNQTTHTSDNLTIGTESPWSKSEYHTGKSYSYRNKIGQSL